MEKQGTAESTSGSTAERIVTQGRQEPDPRWVALQTRNKAADAHFVYGVKTTGVYCRPSCASRLPRAHNVVFFHTVEQAERAGFRACKRCRPREAPADEERRRQIIAACRLIQTSEQEPTLQELAEQLTLSPSHSRRLFKRIVGVSPKAYAAACRAERVRGRLGTARSVTAAAYEAGYSSCARFYADAADMLGMTPTRYRQGGPEIVIRFAVGECSLGSVLVAATARGVCAVFLGDDPQQLVHALERRFSRAEIVGADSAFEKLVATVVGLVERPQLPVELPLDIRGTAFQRRVWTALSKIPPGSTSSYAEIARAIGHPRAVRAVAQACGQNPVAVVIPCHRVVRADGELSGYRWGIERKRALLLREGCIPPG